MSFKFSVLAPAWGKHCEKVSSANCICFCCNRLREQRGCQTDGLNTTWSRDHPSAYRRFLAHFSTKFHDSRWRCCVRCGARSESTCAAGCSSQLTVIYCRRWQLVFCMLSSHVENYSCSTAVNCSTYTPSSCPTYRAASPP